MNEEDARAALRWRYEAPYDFYNPNPQDAEDDVQQLVDRETRYYSVHNERGQLIAHICFGKEARVSGGDYTEEALDVGWGVRPDLTGQGLGPKIIQIALELGRREYSPRAFRATVAAFNQRALKASQKAGFVPRRSFQRPGDGRTFAILTRDI